MTIIVLADTSCAEKRADFEYVFAQHPGVLFLHTYALPCLQNPIPDEIAGTTDGNLQQKQEGVIAPLQALLHTTPWQFYAEIAATRGWIGWSDALSPTSTAPAIDNLIAANGFAAAWQELSAPQAILVLNDDTKTSMAFRKGNIDVPLTFQFLEQAVTTHPENQAFRRLQRAIEDVAAYMQLAQKNKALGQADASLPLENPWDWYMQMHREASLFGLDGSYIAQLLGPEWTLRPLQELAAYAGGLYQLRGDISDIHITAISKVSAAVLQPENPTAAPVVYAAEGRANYRFQPWAYIAQRIASGDKSHLSDVMLLTDAPGSPSVRDRHATRTPHETPVLAREKSLAALCEQLRTRGLLPTASLPPPLPVRAYAASRDVVGLVVAETLPVAERQQWQNRIVAAWGGGIRVDVLDLHAAAFDPATASRVQTYAALFMIDPAMHAHAPDWPQAIHDFLVLGLNREIDATVGAANWSGTPTFVVGNLEDAASGAAALREITDGLYVHGRTKNPVSHIFTAPEAMASCITGFLAQSLVRPSVTADCRPTASRADDSCVVSCLLPAQSAPQVPAGAPVVIALYGGAKPMAAPEDVRLAHRIMDTLVRTQRRDVVTINLAGQELRQLGQLLGVLPRGALYEQRLETALAMMPGCMASRLRTKDGSLCYEIILPVMARPMIFVHGGGEHPYDPLLLHAATSNVMGTFAGGSYLAFIGGETVFVGTHGVTTLPLMRLEGRPEAVPRTNSFAVVAGSTIAERTHATHFPFLETQQTDGAVAIIGSSGIGTLQECLSFPGPLIVAAPGHDPVAAHILRARQAVRLCTQLLDPHQTDEGAEIDPLASMLGEVLPPLSASPASVQDLNRLYPVFVLPDCSR